MDIKEENVSNHRKHIPSGTHEDKPEPADHLGLQWPLHSEWAEMSADLDGGEVFLQQLAGISWDALARRGIPSQTVDGSF